MVVSSQTCWDFQGPLNRGVSNEGVSRSGLVLPFLLFFVLFGTFPIFLGLSRFARGWSGGFSRSVLFLFLGLLRAPTRSSPERVRNTIWTFPKKSGKPPGLETPRFSFSQDLRSCCEAQRHTVPWRPSSHRTLMSLICAHQESLARAQGEIAFCRAQTQSWKPATINSAWIPSAHKKLQDEKMFSVFIRFHVMRYMTGKKYQFSGRNTGSNLVKINYMTEKKCFENFSLSGMAHTVWDYLTGKNSLGIYLEIIFVRTVFSGGCQGGGSHEFISIRETLNPISQVFSVPPTGLKLKAMLGPRPWGRLTQKIESGSKMAKLN